MGDCGLTGRKIIVDTYGGRHVTVVVHSLVKIHQKWTVPSVRSTLCREKHRCCWPGRSFEIQVSYAIGVAEPTSIMVEISVPRKCLLNN